MMYEVLYVSTCHIVSWIFTAVLKHAKLSTKKKHAKYSPFLLHLQGGKRIVTRGGQAGHVMLPLPLSSSLVNVLPVLKRKTVRKQNDSGNLESLETLGQHVPDKCIEKQLPRCTSYTIQVFSFTHWRSCTSWRFPPILTHLPSHDLPGVHNTCENLVARQ